MWFRIYKVINHTHVVDSGFRRKLITLYYSESIWFRLFHMWWFREIVVLHLKFYYVPIIYFEKSLQTVNNSFHINNIKISFSFFRHLLNRTCVEMLQFFSFVKMIGERGSLIHNMKIIILSFNEKPDVRISSLFNWSFIRDIT